MVALSCENCGSKVTATLKYCPKCGGQKFCDTEAYENSKINNQIQQSTSTSSSNSGSFSPSSNSSSSSSSFNSISNSPSYGKYFLGAIGIAVCAYLVFALLNKDLQLENNTSSNSILNNISKAVSTEKSKILSACSKPDGVVMSTAKQFGVDSDVAGPLCNCVYEKYEAVNEEKGINIFPYLIAGLEGRTVNESELGDATATEMLENSIVAGGPGLAAIVMDCALNGIPAKYLHKKNL
jgi:hypothetical protein